VWPWLAPAAVPDGSTVVTSVTVETAPFLPVVIVLCVRVAAVGDWDAGVLGEEDVVVCVSEVDLVVASAVCLVLAPLYELQSH
jgi:hypothetical protein